MTSNKTDVFCIALILILVIYNIAICFNFKNENYDNLVININYLILYVRSKTLFPLVLSKYSGLKVPYLSTKCFLFMLLMIYGDVERLLGPEVMDQTKINVTETYTYLGSTLDPHLNLTENFDKKYKKTSSKLRLLYNISHLLSTKAVTLTYNAMIIPVIKYNCIIHMKLTMGQEKNLVLWIIVHG